MFSEHVDIAEKIRQVFIEQIDDERKICSLEVNVLDLKTFEILLMDRQATIGVDEAESIAAGDEEVVESLLVDLCRTVHTPLYDRRKVLIRTRQHIYAILEQAGLLPEFRREFLQIYDEKFQEEERSDDRSRMLEVALEVDWLKARIAEELARDRDETDRHEGSGEAEDSDGLVTVEISGEQITIDIPEVEDRPEEEPEPADEVAPADKAAPADQSGEVPEAASEAPETPEADSERDQEAVTQEQK